MAIGKNGPFGLYSGKIGAIYGYVLRGQQVLRAQPHITKPRTAKQIAVLKKMSVLTVFFSQISPYLAVGFALSAKKNRNNASNSAKGYNLKNAILGEYPDQYIDYALIRLSEGNLSPALNPGVSAVDEGLKFTWDEAYQESGGSINRTMLMAYFPDKNKAFYVIDGAMRRTAEDLLEIPEDLKGYPAETYISFISNDRKSISNSVYTGQIVF